MAFTLKPSRNATLQLAYALLAAEERKAKKTKKDEEPAVPVKRPPTKKGRTK